METPSNPENAKMMKILGRVRLLIQKAESTDSPQEADALRERADQMMLEYAISEAELDASRPAELRVKPESHHFVMCPAQHPMAKYFALLVSALSEHCRCQSVLHGFNALWGDTTVTSVGFASDLRYLELLFTTIYLHMSGEIEPKPDVTKSFDENVYRLHEAGVKWKRIADLMNHAFRPNMYNWGTDEINPLAAHWRKSVRVGKGHSELVLVPWPDGARLKTAYRRHCALIGESPRAIVSPINFQHNFAGSYVARISARLWEMRQKNTGVGTALVRRQEDVTEAFTEMFPDLGESKLEFKERFDAEAQRAGRESANKADLGGTKVGSDTKPEIEEVLCETTHVLDVWPYTSRCVMPRGHERTHRDIHENFWDTCEEVQGKERCVRLPDHEGDHEDNGGGLWSTSRIELA